MNYQDVLENVEFDFEPVLEHIENCERKAIQKMRQEYGVIPKPVACRHHFGRPGGCVAGDLCPFSHILGEYPMPICIHFMNPKRGCSKGKDCLYRHVIEKCNAYQRGHCPRGPKCSRVHESLPRMCPRIWKQGWCWEEHCEEAHPLQDDKFWEEVTTKKRKR